MWGILTVSYIKISSQKANYADHWEPELKSQGVYVIGSVMADQPNALVLIREVLHQNTKMKPKIGGPFTSEKDSTQFRHFIVSSNVPHNPT